MVEEASWRSNYGVVVTNHFVKVFLVVRSTLLAKACSFKPEREVALVAVAGCMEVVDFVTELLEGIADA